MIIDRDKARNDYLFSHRPIIELPVAQIQHLALYTNRLPLNIAIESVKSIENYNDLSVDIQSATVNMAKQLVKLTRYTTLDTKE